MWFSQNQNLNYQQCAPRIYYFLGGGPYFPKKFLSKIVKQKIKTNQTNKLNTLEGLGSIPQTHREMNLKGEKRNHVCTKT